MFGSSCATDVITGVLHGGWVQAAASAVDPLNSSLFQHSFWSSTFFGNFPGV